MNEIKDSIMTDTNRLQHILMLKSKFVSDVGLLNGKTGIAIAFAHLYEHTHNDVYYDCMSDLLDDVLENTHKGLGIGFTWGLSGIGWGIEYLIQNRFVEGEGLDICTEIDSRIMAFDPRRMTDLSLDNGLEGLLHYILIHIRGNTANRPLPFDEIYFSDLYNVVKSLSTHNGTSSFVQLSSAYIDWYERRSISHYQLNIMQFACSPTVDSTSLNSLQPGIKDGLSGLLLKHLSL